MSDDVKKPVVNAFDAKGVQMSPSAMTAAFGGAPTPPALDDKFSAMMAVLGPALGPEEDRRIGDDGGAR